MKAVDIFQRGIKDALTWIWDFAAVIIFVPTMNGLERLLREVMRRTRVGGIFSGENSTVA